MIRELHLRNFKCFEDQLFRLRPLTLLTGLNGSGKSTVLQALLLLRQSYQQGLLQTNALALNGDLVYIGAGRDALFEGAKQEEIGFEGYPIARWLNDGQVDRDTRSFFRVLATHLSYIDDLPEYWYQEDQAKGLGFAFQHDHLAVSLDSEACWRSSYLEMEIRYLELDESDQLVSDFVQVKHACSPEYVGEHVDWIKERTRIPIHRGSDIWDNRNELYPHLQFCESVGEQLKDILSGDAMLRQIMKTLSELEVFCQNWRIGPFDRNAIPGKVTPESSETLEKYGNVRTFRCPDGQYVIFSWHVRLTPGAWRIHFHPVEVKRQLIIGYIGPHLPTVRFK